MGASGKTAWWMEAVVYQIYPKSFKDSNGDGIGDIRGIIEKLPYLQNLGVDILWISPMYESPNDDNGYDISDYQAIMKEFGTMKDFEKLLHLAHKNGIKIIMDLVVNHTSDEHPWFMESRKSKDNPYRDYYIWKDGKKDAPPNNWGSWFGGSAWQKDEKMGMYYLHIFSTKQPDLNWENPKVREEIYDMMTWWLDKGVDGFRMDVISLISKDQNFPDGEVKNSRYGDIGPYSLHGPKVHEYLKEMNKKVLSKYDIMTVGETSGVTPDEAKKYAGYDSNELNMAFQFEHMSLTEGPYGKWSDARFSLLELKEVLTKWQIELEGRSWNSLFWSNHDQPRAVTRFGDDKKYRELSAKMLAVCLHIMKGTPYIYQGEELGMTNAYFTSLDEYRDIESFRAYKELTEEHNVSHATMMRYLQCIGRDNARTPMQWNDSDQAGFTDGTPWIKVNGNYKTVNAKQQISDESSIYNFYRKLIQLRHENNVILYGTYQLLDKDNEDLYIYTRTLKEVSILVICNFSDNQLVCKTVEKRMGSIKELMIANYPSDQLEIIRPYESKVYMMNS